MLRDICRERGIAFRTLSDSWVLEMEKNGRVQRVIGYQFGLNDAAAAQVAQDKVAVYQVLNSYGVAVVPHFLLRLKAASWKAVDWEEGVVAKPLLGAGGHNVALYFSEAEARAVMQKKTIEAWALSPLQEVAREVRVVLLDNEMMLAYQKQPVVMKGLKVFNLSQGAVPRAYEPSEKVIELAKRAQRAIGLRLCAVDIFELETGEWKVLEVNSGFMMENYARMSMAHKQKTIELYSDVVNKLFE